VDELLSYTLLNFIVIIYISVFDIYIHAYAYMTDDVVTAGGSSSHDDGFNSLGCRTKEPPDPQATLTRASQRNKSMRPREIRDMGKEKLNSRALVERDAKIGSTHRGIFRIVQCSKKCSADSMSNPHSHIGVSDVPVRKASSRNKVS